MKKALGLALGFVLGFALVCALSACMKEPDLKPDYGPVATEEDFKAALGQVTVPDPYSIMQGEYAYFTRQTWIESRPYLVNQRWAYTVRSKTEDANDYLILYHKTLYENIQGQEKPSESETVARLAKKRAATTNSIMNDNAPDAQSLQLVIQSLDPRSRLAFSPVSLLFVQVGAFSTSADQVGPFGTSADQGGSVRPPMTFHNLKMTKASVPVPDYVRLLDNCGGLTADKCSAGLTAYTLSFDQVIWNDSGAQKYSIVRVFSPDVPYFGSTLFPEEPGVIQACVTTLLTLQGRQLLLAQCDEIKAFTFGHP
ncbi:MAG: hypothetical protein C5B49_02770 [Bdellovibrio sp.]|nr:MAG: hypothetical protein C5B49_02770 [Bdellovibrio sp.]